MRIVACFGGRERRTVALEMGTEGDSFFSHLRQRRWRRWRRPSGNWRGIRGLLCEVSARLAWSDASEESSVGVGRAERAQDVFEGGGEQLVRCLAGGLAA